MSWKAVWGAAHAERQALAHDLETLSPEQWATPSLCPGWDVHDVLAHLVDTARETRAGFVWHMLAARGDFHRANADGVTRERRAAPRATLAAFRSVLDRTTTPPAPRATRLIEAFVHGEDVRRPLGLTGRYPVDAVAVALAAHVRASAALGGGRERVADLRLVATDAGVTFGNGPVVAGPAIALLLAAAGRPVALGELAGPGMSVLRARC